MRVTSYRNAGAFLQKTQGYLEKREVENSLMLGICLRLKRSSDRVGVDPYFATAEDEGGLAAAAIMTPPHKLIVCSDREGCSPAFEAIAGNLAQNRWEIPGVLGLPPVAQAFAAAWADVSGAKVEEGMRQRIYALREVIAPEPPGGRLRAATEEDIEWVARWSTAFNQEIFGSSVENAREMAERKIRFRDIYIWEDGGPVSIASRSRPTANGITVNLVYTPPEFRGRGYATACVAALSRLLLSSGWKYCTLNTDLANPTSNSIYQKIGYRPVSDFSEYVFGRISGR